MSSAADLSELASESNLEDKEQESEGEGGEQNEEGQQDQENEDGQEEGEQTDASPSKRHVTFKDNQPDTIQSVFKEVNSISAGIDQFLIKLNKKPQNYSNNSQNLYRQQFQQPQGPIYPNYSQMVTRHQNYQRQVLPQIQQQQQQSSSINQSTLNVNGNNSNKFFYTKQDMTSARQLQNSNTKFINNRRDESQLNQDQNQSMMNTSKYNYYGNYRFQSDKTNKSLLMSQRQSLHQPQQLPTNSQRQTFNDIYSSGYQQKHPQQPAYNPNSYNFSKNIGDINSQVEQLAQSIHQDTATNFYSSAQQNPSLYQGSISKQSQSLQRNSYAVDSINQRQNNLSGYHNTLQQNKFEIDDHISNKTSFQNSLNMSRPQNVRDLYKHRPKRVIDESELYGDIQQTLIPNKISVLRSNY